MNCEEKEMCTATNLPAEETGMNVNMENDEEVVAIRKKNAAAAYLRKQDCQMLTILKALLGENIRLNGILYDINAEIVRLNKILKTPKPKFKVGLFLLGLLVGAAFYFVLNNVTLAMIGAVIAAIPIIIKIVRKKKWKKLMEETNAALRVQEEKAAQQRKQIEEHWMEQVVPYIVEITPDRFPAAYVCDYGAVCTMLFGMENLIADTIKEAVAYLEETQFRTNMVMATEDMKASLRSTARSAARSAAAAERSAIANERAAASAAVTAASSVSMAYSAARAAKAAESVAKVFQD